MELINSVLKQDPSDTAKERMKKVANTFMTHRQIGEAEAVYRLLPNMVLKNSNVACQWLAVGKRSEMSKRWKLATKKELESGDKRQRRIVVSTTGHAQQVLEALPKSRANLSHTICQNVHNIRSKAK